MKVEIEEIKTYKCSDGSVFDSKAVAEAHEADLKDPNYLLIKRIDELEKKIQHLEAENLKRISEIECARYPYGKINHVMGNKDTSPWMPQVYYCGAFNNAKEATDAVTDIINNVIGGNK